MKKLFLSISLLLAVANVYAIPAKRGIWRNIPIAGGVVRAELAGDEYFSYYITEAGVCYAQNVNSGLYEPVDITAMQKTAEIKRTEANKSRMNRVATRKKTVATRTTNVKKGLVILVEFSDMKFSAAHTQQLYNNILNAENFKDENGFVGSVRDYFRDQSKGKLLVDFDVAGPVQLPNGYAYYGQNSGSFNSDAHPDEMVETACRMINDAVNFADYDWDGDGEADQVCILYAGRGEASGGDVNTIWPHESKLTRYGRKVEMDGVKIDTYACSCELGEKGTIDGIGTFCHEFSHCLGIPDMYDTSGTGNYGMYKWDIMGFGNYNGDGFIPSAYTSYERWIAGWIEPVELTENTDVTGMKTLDEDGGLAYIVYNNGNRNEYYLLENRRKSGWDAAQAGEGLLITHVDYDEKVWHDNTVNSGNSSHQHLSVIAADNSYEMTDNDCAGDVFPYNGNNSITSSTTPAATLFNKNTDGSYFMNKDITDIVRNEDGTISFSFRISDTKPQPDADGNWLYESFNSCAGIGGNDGKWGNAATGGYPNGFIPDNSGWSDGLPGNNCAKINATISSPLFYFGDGAILTFKAAPCSGYDTNLIVGTDRGTLSQTTFTMKDGEWTEFQAILSGEGYTQLTFTTGGSFFIDEVRVSDSSSTGIWNIETPVSTSAKGIYSIDGRYMGNSLDGLGKGIYIVNGKKVIK